jgi:hypothetical protein
LAFGFWGSGQKKIKKKQPMSARTLFGQEFFLDARRRDFFNRVFESPYRETPKNAI